MRFSVKGRKVDHEVTEKVVSNLSDPDRSESHEEDEEFLRPTPTDEELVTLRKVRDAFPLSAFLIAIVELAERFTYYGLTGPFQNYIQRPRDYHPASGGKAPGGIGRYQNVNQNQQMATGLTTFFQFWCYVTPIPMGMLADMKLGKYWTICISAGIYVCGLLVLFVTSLPQYMEKAGLGGLIACMILIGVGTGGIKSNVSTLIAEQYTNTRPFVRTLKSGERVIVDPGTTVEFIYSVFYWCINIGSLSAIATTELEKNVDFWAAYLLPFCFFFVAIFVLIIGKKKYVVRPPAGSPVPQAFRILCIAWKNAMLPKSQRYTPAADTVEAHEIKIKKSKFVESMNNFVYSGFKWWTPFASRFTFEIAKPSVRANLGLPPVPWSDIFVEEVGRAFEGCKVFIYYPIFWVCYSQISNNLTSQAGQTNTHKLPNDILQNLDPITIIIFIPIFNSLVYPTLKKMGFLMLPITRITFGFFVAAISMAYTAGFQKMIYNTGPCYQYPQDDRCPVEVNGVRGSVANDIHVAIQTPSWFFMGISEILCSVTGNEFAFKYAPASMKAFVMGLFLLTNAIGSAINEALNPTLVNPKILWMYAGIGIAAFIAGIVFWFVYQDLNDKELYYQKLSGDVAADEKENRRDAEEASFTAPFAELTMGHKAGETREEEEKKDAGIINAAVFSPA